MCVSCRRGRRDAERRTRAGVTRRGGRSGQRARLGTRDAGRAFRERARRASLGIRRSRRVADDDRRPRRLTRETSMDAGGLLFSRRRGISGTRPRSAIETAPAWKCARARVPCPARNKPPPVSGARCRTPRTGTTSDGATRVYFCCESGHRTLYRGRRCRCSSRWRRWRCCTACKASSRPIAGLRDDTDPSRPRVHASPRPRFSRPDATRRLFPRRLRERQTRRCLLRSAMDRPRKRARGPTPTRPSSNFAPRRVSASRDSSPEARVTVARTSSASARRAERSGWRHANKASLAQAYPEWCRTPKTCCRVTRGSAHIESHVRNTRSPERTSRDCLLIRFSEISFKSSLDHRFPHPLARV